MYLSGAMPSISNRTERAQVFQTFDTLDTGLKARPGVTVATPPSAWCGRNAEKEHKEKKEYS